MEESVLTDKKKVGGMVSSNAARIVNAFILNHPGRWGGGNQSAVETHRTRHNLRNLRNIILRWWCPLCGSIKLQEGMDPS